MSAELFAKYVCTYCQEDCPGIRVNCVDCEEFDLCFQCFAAGAEIGSHKNNHAYKFMDSGVLSVYKGGWSAREELHLLDAIEQYGFGNWEDISKHIETRTPEEAKEEYINKFLNGTVGRHTWSIAADQQRPKLTDHTQDDTGPLSQLLTQKLPPLDITNEEAAQLGYMPNRDDFEKEFDPTAEKLVSTLSLEPDDDDIDVLLKLAQVDSYTRRLRERARRKRLVRDYQLVANFFRGNKKRATQSRDQREFRERLRTFAQFYTSLEFERLISSLERERALRVRLSELNRYRWNGLTRMDELVHFEQHAAAAQHRNTGSYGHGRTDNQNNIDNGEKMVSLESLHSQTTRKGERSEGGLNTSFIDQKPMYHTDDQVYLDGSYNNKNYLDSSPTQILQPQQPMQNPSQQLGGELLTNNELKLCSNLNLPVTRYITLKTVFLSNGATGNEAQIANISDSEHTIRNHLIKSGWIHQEEESEKQE